MKRVSIQSVEIIDESDPKVLQNHVNLLLSFFKENESELIDIKYTMGDNRYSAMVIFRDFQYEDENGRVVE